MSLLAKPLLFVLALAVNSLLYLAVPFMQAWMHQKALQSNPSPKIVERELALAPLEPEKIVKREIKEIKLQIQSPNLTQGRPSSPGGGLKIDLSTAGGDGMSLVSGGDRSGPLGSGTGGGQGTGIGSMVYEPGQTDSDARMVGPDVPPKFPPRAQREGVAGYVDLLFVVNESGMAEQFVVLKEEPQSFGFATAAIESVKRLRFQPAMIQKTSVQQKLRRRISFEL